MMKYLNKLLLIFLCTVMTFSALTGVVNAETSYYKIPKYKNFRPNKAANDIENIVNQKSIIEIEGTDNKFVIDGDKVSEINKSAVEEMNGYKEKLEKNGMKLNRDLTNTVTVQLKNIDFSDYAEISIDNSSIKKTLDVNNLKIILNNRNEYIEIDKTAIGEINENYGMFKIQVKKITNTYTLRFVDVYGTIINKYKTDIKVALPSKNSEQTVYLLADNNQENWGGQYNSRLDSIEFMTKYTGEYNVSAPQIIVNDIDDLSEYEQQAIRFMLVRGYFETDNGLFNPNDALSRYDFARSLVGMFFALDNDAKCSFADVNKKNYKYVAASQKDNIVQGFDDGTFRGDENVTVEQVIALASRTINLRNGYLYPENVSKYLNFESSNTIGDWAEKEVALAIREGIYAKEMKLKFSSDISRKDAAVILYRLFMIMNNTPEATELVEYDLDNRLSHTFWTGTNAVIVCATMAFVDIIILVISLLYIKRKKQSDKEEITNKF